MAAPPGTPRYVLATTPGRLFVALEAEFYQSGGAVPSAGFAIAEAGIAATPTATQAGDGQAVRASDLGYVSRASDSPATAVYPPTLEGGFASNRTLALEPGSTNGAVAWGTLDLVSDDRRYDAGLAGRNADLRPVAILAGRKGFDPVRGLHTDPPYASLATVFRGLGGPHQPRPQGISLQIRDFTAMLERPYQARTYGGTGGLDGSAGLAGRAVPRLRGGTAVNPVRNISPVLIDPVANIWQWNDGPGEVIEVYEDGAAVFAWIGDATDLYSGSVLPGYYRSDLARGLTQFGSPVAGAITMDAVGHFPVAGAISNAGSIARAMLIEDVGLTSAELDEVQFAFLFLFNPFVAGWYWDGAQPEDAATAVGRLLASFGCALLPTRDGQVSVIMLRALAPDSTPVATYGPADLGEVSRVTLPVPLAAPTYRIRWGYQHNHTVQTSGLLGSVTEERRAWLAEADRFATATSAEALLAYRRPNDYPPVPSALLRAEDAQTMAARMISLWGVERRLFTVEMPLDLALRHDVGDVLRISYPIEDLDGAGKRCRIVAEAFRTAEGLSTFTVLI